VFVTRYYKRLKHQRRHCISNNTVKKSLILHKSDIFKQLYSGNCGCLLNLNLLFDLRSLKYVVTHQLDIQFIFSEKLF